MKTDLNTFSLREHERVRVAMPVYMAGQYGVTRDVSAGGVYFELKRDIRVGSEISFEIGLEHQQEMMRVRCQGIVVRTECMGDRTGIAVKLADMRLESME